ncbi:DMT family transporter [Candidatus Poribacteria bacterium]|nr:DMT family transporter [Candidatus Poribacteria bacterium]
MIEKEFRNEDPSGKIIVLILFVVSLLGAGSLSVKIGLQGFPPLKMALLRSILGLIVVGGIGFCYGVSMRLRFEELPRLLLLAALQALHTITMNVGTQFTTASRSTICHTLYPVFVVLFGHFWLPGDRLSPTKLLGILAAFGGMFVALAPNLQGVGVVEHLIGDLIVTLSACLLAFRITLTKLFVQEIYPYRLLVLPSEIRATV